MTTTIIAQRRQPPPLADYAQALTELEDEELLREGLLTAGTLGTYDRVINEHEESGFLSVADATRQQAIRETIRQKAALIEQEGRDRKKRKEEQDHGNPNE